MIVDMVVVLVGQGKGNKMVKGVEEGLLFDVIVSWKNDLDWNYVIEWFGNVIYEFFEDVVVLLEVEVDEFEGEIIRVQFVQVSVKVKFV